MTYVLFILAILVIGFVGFKALPSTDPKKVLVATTKTSIATKISEVVASIPETVQVLRKKFEVKTNFYRGDRIAYATTKGYRIATFLGTRSQSAVLLQNGTVVRRKLSRLEAY